MDLQQEKRLQYLIGSMEAWDSAASLLEEGISAQDAVKIARRNASTLRSAIRAAEELIAGERKVS